MNKVKRLNRWYGRSLKSLTGSCDEPNGNVLDEAIDTIAMCFRYLETGDRYRQEGF